MDDMQKAVKGLRKALNPDKKTPEENKALCERFPFLSWYGDPQYIGYSEAGEPDYEYTWEDELPVGWRKAMCPQIWEDLKAILEEANYVNQFRFCQIKEKWGELRMYYSGLPNEIADKVYAWEDKYVKLSEEHCIGCGGETKYMTLGWITYICEDCAKKRQQESLRRFGDLERVIPLEDIEEYYKNPDAYCESHPVKEL